jgi:lipid II:glycine glycyltransferase (peptidoglycan interpeptide bridge formation enzyme)
MIQRAEREDLLLETGNSSALLSEFYSLLLLTRRRHQLPPQPVAWFRNLADCFGERLSISLARKGREAIAAILTVNYRNKTIYKYGCSDAARHNLGGMQFLIWNAIRVAKEQGVEEFDMGRSELTNESLIKFKDRWAGIRSELIYYRYPWQPSADRATGWRRDLAGRILSSLPDSCLAATGRILYKHVG